MLLIIVRLIDHIRDTTGVSVALTPRANNLIKDAEEFEGIVRTDDQVVISIAAIIEVEKTFGALLFAILAAPFSAPRNQLTIWRRFCLNTLGSLRDSIGHPDRITSTSYIGPFSAIYQRIFELFTGLLRDRGMLAPEDISAAVLWLASEEARHITGYAMPIDAGFLTQC